MNINTYNPPSFTFLYRGYPQTRFLETFRKSEKIVLGTLWVFEGVVNCLVLFRIDKREDWATEIVKKTSAQGKLFPITPS